MFLIACANWIVRIENIKTWMNSWRGFNKLASELSIICFNWGKCFRIKAGIGILDLVVFADWKKMLLHSMRRLKSSSFLLNLLPPIIAHRMLMTYTEKNSSLISTTWFGSLLAVFVISWISSLISSIIWSSMDVFPKPRSRIWRKVNLRCSCQNAPWLKINPGHK